MAVAIETLKNGLKLPTRSGRKRCPECGQQMKIWYHNELRGFSAQCLNPNCPHLYNNERKDESQMTVMVAKKAEFEVIPTGEYLAQITDYEEEQGNFGPQFKFRLEIVKPKQYAEKTQFYWTSQKLTSGQRKSKLWAFVEAAFNRMVEEGEQVDLDDVIGRQVIMVLINDSKDDGSEFNKISSIKAYKNQQVFPKPASGQQTMPGTTAADKIDDPFDDDPFANE